jgi:hypothetical protein
LVKRGTTAKAGDAKLSPLQVACADALRACPCVIGASHYTCDDEGLVIEFAAASDDAHNVDFIPALGEWITGLFASAQTGTFYLHPDGRLDLVGQDDFTMRLRVRTPEELIAFVTFFHDARANLASADPAIRSTRALLESRAREEADCSRVADDQG